MQLLEQEGQWYWINHENKVVSPRFNTKELAEEWYGLHEGWLERPAILEPELKNEND